MAGSLAAGVGGRRRQRRRARRADHGPLPQGPRTRFNEEAIRMPPGPSAHNAPPASSASARGLSRSPEGAIREGCAWPDPTPPISPGTAGVLAGIVDDGALSRGGPPAPIRSRSRAHRSPALPANTSFRNDRERASRGPVRTPALPQGNRAPRPCTAPPGYPGTPPSRKPARPASRKFRKRESATPDPGTAPFRLFPDENKPPNSRRFDKAVARPPGRRNPPQPPAPKPLERRRAPRYAPFASGPPLAPI